MEAEELVKLLDSKSLDVRQCSKAADHTPVVNPRQENGRVTLITRYGAQKVEQHLPGHIAAVQKSEHPVAWVCDPMHGKYVNHLRLDIYT